MATFWLEEFSDVAVDKHGRVLPVPAGICVNQKLTIGSEADLTLADTTKYIRIHADAACYFEIGESPTASATTSHLLANVYVDRYVGQDSGLKVSVVQIA